MFSKGAKFSMFKPAEEMVYIGLDEESRTKGKAAIDVVGAQTGKSIGSVLQQALLLATGGVMAGASHLSLADKLELQKLIIAIAALLCHTAANTATCWRRRHWQV